MIDLEIIFCSFSTIYAYFIALEISSQYTAPTANDWSYKVLHKPIFGNVSAHISPTQCQTDPAHLYDSGREYRGWP